MVKYRLDKFPGEKNLICEKVLKTNKEQTNKEQITFSIKVYAEHITYNHIRYKY